MKRLATMFILATCIALPAVAGAADISKSLQTIFRNEGGYQCDRNDSGNWTGGKVGKGRLVGTKYGLAAATYPKEDIKHLTLQKAALYYSRDYAGPLLLTRFKSQGLATTFLDTAVNCGAGTAAILVEKTVNILNGNGADFPLDARVTPATVEWINAYTRQKEQRRLFYLVFSAVRSERYVAICKADQRKHRYLDDWLVRTWDY